MNDKQKLLIVEDETAIRTGLLDVFVYHGFEVTAAETGDSGLALALSQEFDLILLDVMLPGINGYEILKTIRDKDKHQAIIMLTAKSSDDEIIEGLSLGADDYVAKPFSIAQLVLRVQAVLRRTSSKHNESTIHLINDRIIDTQNLIIAGDDSSIVFTKKEMEVILFLNAHRDRPISREEMLEEVWGYDKSLDIETRTVDIHIAKIRRKIERDAKKPEALLTVRGAGYRLMVK